MKNYGTSSWFFPLGVFFATTIESVSVSAGCQIDYNRATFKKSDEIEREVIIAVRVTANNHHFEKELINNSTNIADSGAY